MRLHAVRPRHPTCRDGGYHRWRLQVRTRFVPSSLPSFKPSNSPHELVAEYWANVSETARDFVTSCLTLDASKRPTAIQCLEHKWLADIEKPHFVPDPESASGAPIDLLPHIQKQFNAKKTCEFLLLLGMDVWMGTEVCLNVVRKAVLGMMAVRRMSSLGAQSNEIAEHLQEYKNLAENVSIASQMLSSIFGCALIFFFGVVGGDQLQERCPDSRGTWNRFD